MSMPNTCKISQTEREVLANRLKLIAETEFNDADRLLEIWAEAQQRWRPNVGYPRRSAGLSSGGGSGEDAFDHLCEQADGFVAKTVEGIVDNLPIGYKAILTHTYLASVYAFRLDPEDALRGALTDFWRLAKAKGLA